MSFPDVQHRIRDGSRGTVLITAGTLGGTAVLIGAVATKTGQDSGLMLSAVAVGLVAIVTGLSNPVVALSYLLITIFFRLAIPANLLPVEPFLLAFGGLVLSVLIWVRRHHVRVPEIGRLEILISLYVLWNIGSMLAPHPYPPIYPQDGTTLSVSRFVIIGAAMPLMSLLLGRVAFGRDRAIRLLLLSVMIFAAYSALVSILQFYVPSLVYPRYIVDAPSWEGRAVGVFNQPAVNGLVMVLGYLAGVLVASKAAGRLYRIAGGALAASCCFGIYLTHTRVVWLSFVLVVVLGLWLARGWRRGFVITLALMVLAVATNWSTFTSSDREAGGVGSTNEVFDRLNMIATSMWALHEKPLLGWGIGRFAAVNTYHHQQFSPSIPWNRGYAYVSHFDVLGIAVELGLIGVSLWLLMMATILTTLLRSLRRLPEDDMYGRPFGLFALLALLTLLITGLTVDLRFFDFPNILVLLSVGAVIGRAEQYRRAEVP